METARASNYQGGSAVVQAFTNTDYTYPIFSEACGTDILYNPMTGLRLGATPASVMGATWGPLVMADYGLSTGAQLAGWNALNLARRLMEGNKKLDRIAALTLDWDTYGSGAATQFAVDTSRNFMWNVAISLAGELGIDASPYDVAPLSGGGVQIEWRGDSGSIQVEVSPEGRFGFLLLLNGRRSEEADDVPSELLIRLIQLVY